MTPPQRPAGLGFPRRTFVIGALVTLSSLVAIRGDDSSQRQMLDQYVQILQSGVESTELELQTLEGDISDLQQEIEDLIQRIETAAESGEAPAPRAEREEPSEVRFRPPQARAAGSVAKTVLIWCESNQVSVVNQDALLEAADRGFAELEPQLRSNADVPPTGRWVATRGDFDCAYEVLEDRSGAAVWMERKAGAGEDTAQALRDGSDYRQAISGGIPSGTLLIFAVHSDSFDLFRRLRTDAIESDYQVFWLPCSHDAHLFPGSGDLAVIR